MDRKLDSRWEDKKKISKKKVKKKNKFKTKNFLKTTSMRFHAKIKLQINQLHLTSARCAYQFRLDQNRSLRDAYATTMALMLTLIYYKSLGHYVICVRRGHLSGKKESLFSSIHWG